VQTNIVYFDVAGMTGLAFEDECRKRDLLSGATGEHRVRFVTHNGITAQDVQAALKVCGEVLSA
jgi:threonine aldolase